MEPQLHVQHPVDAHDRVIGLGHPKTQLPMQRHRGGHVAGLGLQAKDVEAEVGGGLDGCDHEVPAEAETAGFGATYRRFNSPTPGSNRCTPTTPAGSPSTAATSRQPLVGS